MITNSNMVPLPGRSVLPTLIFSLVSIWATGALAAVGADLTQEAVHRRGDESVPKDSHTGGLIWPGDAAVNDIDGRGVCYANASLFRSPPADYDLHRMMGHHSMFVWRFKAGLERGAKNRLSFHGPRYSPVVRNPTVFFASPSSGLPERRVGFGDLGTSPT